MTRIDTISEGSSKSSLNGDHPVPTSGQDEDLPKTNSSDQAAERRAGPELVPPTRTSPDLPKGFTGQGDRRTNGHSCVVGGQDSTKFM